MTPIKCKLCARPVKSKGLCNSHVVKEWRQKNPKKSKEIYTKSYQKFKNTEKYNLWYQKFKNTEKYNLWRRREKLKRAKLTLERLKKRYPELF